ncbi:MAG TPA: cytochrome b/b6 domain-containing protein [Gemmatimonadales bacterium]|nr:cytochrome b/b6 domain-containing protein [Gemmatimonadales bacterium]
MPSPVSRPSPRGAPPAGDVPRTPVLRHHWLVRLTHWLNALLLVGMVASGLQIYGAYAHFGPRGGPYLGPNPWDGRGFPEWARLGGWLAGGINWHFTLAWPFVLTGLVYLAYLAVSGEWRSLLVRPRDLPRTWQMQLYYLRLRKAHPPQGKHDALQKAAYTGIVVLGAVATPSGFAIHKPVQLGWLTAAFGGFEHARSRHFVSVWIFAGFTLLHVALVLVAGPTSLRAACGRDGGRCLEPTLRAVSRLNDRVGERLIFSPDRLAPEYPRSSRTPERHFPACSLTKPASRLVPPEGWALDVGGLVRRPVRLTPAMPRALPSERHTVKHHCVEGWTAVATWTGAPVATIAALAEPTAPRGSCGSTRSTAATTTVGTRERHAPPDDPRPRPQRPSAGRRPRRPAPAQLADQARVQTHEVSHPDDLHRGAAGRVPGSPGLPLVRGRLSPGAGAHSSVRNRTSALPSAW